MEGDLVSVSAAELYAHLGTAWAPALVGVRRQDAFDADDKLIIGALRRAPEEVDRWSWELPVARTVVAYCSRGGDISQGVASTRHAAGAKAACLAGDISAWQEMQLPRRRKLSGRADNNG